MGFGLPAAAGRLPAALELFVTLGEANREQMAEGLSREGHFDLFSSYPKEGGGLVPFGTEAPQYQPRCPWLHNW